MIYSQRLFVVYKISNLINNMVYIGVTSVGIKKRYSTHLSIAKKGSSSKLHIDMIKYGVNNFKIEEIDSINTDSVMYANNLEFEYIKKYNSIYPNGYNVFGFSDRKKYHTKGITGTNF